MFRDYLRSHRDVSHVYHELKLRLAAQYRHDRFGNGRAKTDFILAVLECAKVDIGTTSGVAQ